MPSWFQLSNSFNSPPSTCFYLYLFFWHLYCTCFYLYSTCLYCICFFLMTKIQYLAGSICLFQLHNFTTSQLHFNVLLLRFVCGASTRAPRAPSPSTSRAKAKARARASSSTRKAKRRKVVDSLGRRVRRRVVDSSGRGDACDLRAAESAEGIYFFNSQQRRCCFR